MQFTDWPPWCALSNPSSYRYGADTTSSIKHTRGPIDKSGCTEYLWVLLGETIDSFPQLVPLDQLGVGDEFVVCLHANVDIACYTGQVFRSFGATLKRGACRLDFGIVDGFHQAVLEDVVSEIPPEVTAAAQ